MSHLIDTTEMYLRTIYDLEEEGVIPLRARIAERLDQSGPTVSQTVSRMERDGLLHVAGDRHLELTDKGRKMAEKSMRGYWEQLEQALGALGKPDTEELIRLMNRLCELLEAGADDNDGSGDEEKTRRAPQRS